MQQALAYQRYAAAIFGMAYKVLRICSTCSELMHPWTFDLPEQFSCSPLLAGEQQDRQPDVTA